MRQAGIHLQTPLDGPGTSETRRWTPTTDDQDAVPRRDARRPYRVDPRFAQYRKSRDQQLRNALIEHHRWLAVYCARRFNHKGEPIDDLIQVAVVGLIKAVERFDPNFGVAFSTFAMPTMIGELRRHFRDKTWSVHVPRGAKEHYQFVSDVIGELTALLGRAPTVPEIADFASLTDQEVSEAIKVGECYRGTPLERPKDDDSGLDVVPVGGPDPGYEVAENRVAAKELLDELDDERERHILELRYFEDMTQCQIADRVGVSQVQVSRLLRASLEQMRRKVTPAHC